MEKLPLLSEHLSNRIASDPGICGGSARIRGTRIPVWSITQCQNRGLSDAVIIEMYPVLELADIQAARLYASEHPDEIAGQIHRAEEDE